MNNFLNTWYQYCPHCQRELKLKATSASCSSCSFVFYDNPAPCVTVLIEKNNKFLFAKRGINPQKGFWDLPGGFIEAGETIEEAVLREVKEETTLEVKIVKYLGNIADIYGDTQVATLNFLFLTQVIVGEAKARDDVAMLTWFDKNNLPQDLAFKNCYAAIERYKTL